MLLRPPVNPNKPSWFFVNHASPVNRRHGRRLFNARANIRASPQTQATPVPALSGAIFPRAIGSRSLHRGKSPLQALTNKIGAQDETGCSRRIDSVRGCYARYGPSPCRARFVPLRFTSRALQTYLPRTVSKNVQDETLLDCCRIVGTEVGFSLVRRSPFVSWTRRSPEHPRLSPRVVIGPGARFPEFSSLGPHAGGVLGGRVNASLIPTLLRP